MNWNAQLFSYCERGLDPGFWAEPLNAASNAAFFIAAGVAIWQWASIRTPDRPAWGELALAMLVVVIGIGSFLFHTYATKWAVLADVMPITVFMIAYLGYALRRFVGIGWVLTIVALVAFFGALNAAEMVKCGGRPCLNGSLGYMPALAVLAAIGAWLVVRGHPAGPILVAGAVLFAVSLALRTIDRPFCPNTAFFSRRVLGTHFLWHILNAALLFLLLRAALRHGGSRMKKGSERTA